MCDVGDSADRSHPAVMGPLPLRRVLRASRHAWNCDLPQGWERNRPGRATSGGGVLVSRRLLRPGCEPCSPESPSRTTPRPHRPHRGPSAGGDSADRCSPGPLPSLEDSDSRRRCRPGVGRPPASRRPTAHGRNACCTPFQTRCGRERITPFAVRGAGRPGPPAARARWSPAGWRCRGRGSHRRPPRVRAAGRRRSAAAAPRR